MGVYNRGSLGYKYVEGRSKNRVYSLTKHKNTRNLSSKKLFTRVCYYRRNNFFVRKVCYRTCSYKRDRSGLLQHNLCSTKTKRRTSSDFKFKTVKSSSGSSSFQNGNFKDYYESIKKGGSCSDFRSDRCISSRTNSSKIQKVSPVPISRTKFSIPGNAIRPTVFSKSVHKDNGSLSSIFEKTGHPHLHVSGRLVDSKFRQGKIKMSTGLHPTSNSQTRSNDKPEEVKFSSDSESGILRSSFQFKGGNSYSVRGTFRENCGNNSNSKNQSDYSSGRDIETVRSNGIMHLSYSDGSSSHAPYTAVPVSLVETSCSTTTSMYSNKEQFASTPNLVDKSHECFQRDAFATECSRGDTHDRCFVNGIRGSFGQWLADGRKVAETVSKPTHQLVGNESGFSSSSGGKGFCVGKNCINQVRQFNCNKLSEQRRRNSFSRDVLSDMGSFSVVYSEQCNNSSCSHTGQQKFSCGCSFQGKVQCAHDGMDPKYYGGEFNISTDVNSNHRLVCNSSQQQVAGLLLPSARCECFAGGCSNNGLDGSLRLCISSANSNTSSLAKSTGRELCDPVDSSNVAKTVLVPSSLGNVDRNTNKVTNSSKSAITTSKSNVSSRSRNVKSCSMEVIKLKHCSAGFSERTANIMANARKSSTQTVYDARIRIYDSWCKEQHIDPFQASLPQIADFFMYLFSVRNCKPKTITGYKSVISLIHNDGSKISSSSELTALIKGLYNMKPSVKPLTPNWNLPLVLAVLTKHPFEPIDSIDLKFLTYKTVFLLALASASRVSELHSLSLDEGHYRKEHKGIRLLPNMQFLAKTQTLNKAWEPIYIPSFDSFATDSMDLKLCPCRALKMYVNKTKDIRKSNRLFVTYQENNHKEASKDSIARWIVSTVRFAYENADKDTLKTVRAHDTRRLSTSWALFNGVSSSEILKAAHWSSETTFTSFYLKDVPDHQAIFARSAILGTARRQ